MVNQRITAIVAIDLSAAFDTVDHQSLINVLNKKSQHRRCSISGSQIISLQDHAK